MASYTSLRLPSSRPAVVIHALHGGIETSHPARDSVAYFPVRFAESIPDGGGFVFIKIVI